MEKIPILTVVTTTYNQKKFLGQALEGILMQKTTFPFQVVVSDDCSTDGTTDILRKFAEKYPNIIKPIFHKHNLGAMNNFIETLNGIHTKYVAFCDGDDFWTDPNKLQKQVDFLDNNADYSICFHQVSVFYEDESKEKQVYPVNIIKTTEFDDLVKECYIPANSVVYRWKFQSDNSFISAFPKDIVPGDYFVHLLHAESGKIYFIKEVMSAYRRHDGGMWWLTSDPSKENEFYLKYGNRYINFYNAVESRFNIDPSVYYNVKKYIITKSIVSYSQNNCIDELSMLNVNNTKLFTECVMELNRTDPYGLYYHWSLPKRILYLLLFDFNTLKDKIIKKFKRK